METLNLPAPPEPLELGWLARLWHALFNRSHEHVCLKQFGEDCDC